MGCLGPRYWGIGNGKGNGKYKGFRVWEIRLCEI